MTPLSKVAQLAESFLFMEGGPLSWKRLAGLLGEDEQRTRAAVEELAVHLEGSGLAIVSTDREVSLATSKATSEQVKAVFEQQLQKDIGEAGLEVVATLLYRGPSKRSEIDYIRGVNTASTVRNLLSRGLIERSINEGREYLYQVTPELLAHLGVRNPEEVPEYATIRAQLVAFENSKSPFDEHATDDITDERRGAQ